MWKLIKVLLAGIAVSFYFFPFEFTFLPGVNTKMAMAVLGVLLAIIQLIRRRESRVPPNIVKTILFASGVSLVGLLSVIYNNTVDYVYSSYVVSMLVWLSAAYLSCLIIKWVHNDMNVKIVANYIITICLLQCVIAQFVAAYPTLKTFVDTYIEQGQAYLNEVNRLYGIGASLDVAGSRFSVALALCLYLLANSQVLNDGEKWFYVIAIIAIVILGSMIARTTYVGIVIGGIYLILKNRGGVLRVSKKGLQAFFIVSGIILIVVPILASLYNTNPEAYRMLRFAFEGFFNLAETGEWSIASNETLKTMYVFPESLKTWIIGDGYFNNPISVDPYYVGPITGGYYMGTDVGYLRFIFYFGIIGLVSFIIFFVKVTQYCISGLRGFDDLLKLLLLINFTIWFKVSTDIFLVFALFLCVANMQPEEELKSDDIVQE